MVSFKLKLAVCLAGFICNCDHIPEFVKTVGSINGDPVFKRGLPILVPSQYIDLYYISEYKGARAMKTTNGSSQLIWRDDDITNLDTFTPNNLSDPDQLGL